MWNHVGDLAYRVHKSWTPDWSGDYVMAMLRMLRYLQVPGKFVYPCHMQMVTWKNEAQHFNIVHVIN